nr:unnamed protein product [Spirometra erinaceieuropaei]
MVESGVPQGSVLGPILFLIYVDDAARDLDCEVAMFADDMKIWSVVRGPADEDRLQMNLNRLEEWSNRWLLRFNVAKCSILRLGNTARSASTRGYFLGGAALQEVEAQKDLGVLTTSSLKPSAHCSRVAKSAMSVLLLCCDHLFMSRIRLASHLRIQRIETSEILPRAPTHLTHINYIQCPGYPDIAWGFSTVFVEKVYLNFFRSLLLDTRSTRCSDIFIIEHIWEPPAVLRGPPGRYASLVCVYVSGLRCFGPYREQLSSKVLFPFIIGVYTMYYLLSARSHPRMYARPSKISGFFKNHLQFVRDVHTPFVWGFTGRVQTLLRPLFNTVSKPIYEEEVVTVSDGGEMKLSWYADQHRNDSCPIAIVLPGLAGCACNHYVVTLVKGIAKRGYRCVVVNSRGTCRQKLKTPRAYCASSTEDLSEAISAIQNRYPEAPLCGIGISLGAINLFNYLSCFGDDAVPEPNAVHVGKMKGVAGKPCPLRAGMCISMPWDLCESTRSLEGSVNWLLFNRPLTSNLCKLVGRNADVLSEKYDVPKILRAFH